MRAALVLTVFAAGCGSNAAEPPARPPATTTTAAAEPAPRLLTVRDDGRTYTLAVGGTASLRVPNTAEGDATVEGDAVTLSPVDYFAPTDFREWAVTAERAGEAVVTAPRAGGGRFRVTIRVE